MAIYNALSVRNIMPCRSGALGACHLVAIAIHLLSLTSGLLARKGTVVKADSMNISSVKAA